MQLIKIHIFYYLQFINFSTNKPKNLSQIIDFYFSVICNISCKFLVSVRLYFAADNPKNYPKIVDRTAFSVSIPLFTFSLYLERQTVCEVKLSMTSIIMPTAFPALSQPL